jgi:hypothetical protein
MGNICLACKNPGDLTDEHIIPQALGGRLKQPLYCKICNDNFGRSIDSELMKQFGYIATQLKIKRERGEPPPFKVLEIKEQIKLLFNGNTFMRKDPIVNIEVDNDNKTLKSANITARSKNELKKIIDSIRKRYNIIGEIATFQEVNAGPTTVEHEITIDNTLIRRAVSKIAYGLLCTKVPRNVVLSSAFDEVRVYILEGKGLDRACANFIHTQFMSDYIRPLHMIHIALNRSEKIVVGYVSLFGVYRFTVLLSDEFTSQFEWPSFVYTFDPIRLQEVHGNKMFMSPNITKENILHPKQSKELVLYELNRGKKVIESYIDNYAFLGGELSNN